MSIEQALKDAGLVGLPFSWGADGSIQFGEGLTDGQRAAIQAAVASGMASNSPPVPAVVTMRQARLALLQSGLLSQVNTAVAAMPGAAGDTARIEWEFSSTVERNRPLVQSLIGALGLTDAQLDDLFRLAATL